MLIIAISTLAFTSSLTSYYIYSYHAQHFKETIFLKSVEIYSKVKMKYHEYLPKKIKQNQLHDDQNNESSHPIEIQDVKILRNHEIINFEVASFGNLKWNHLSNDSLIHVCYCYQNCNYRIIFSYGQNLEILTTQISWIQDGLLNGIEKLETNLIDPELRNLMQIYAGPLGDFYQEAEIQQNHLGFLITNLEQSLFSTLLSKNQYNPYIKITNILGEFIIFGLLTKSL